MAEAIAAGLFQVLVEKISGIIASEIRLQCSIHSELQKLKSSAGRIQSILRDGLGHPMSAVQENLIQELRQVSYMADDVVEEFMVTAAKGAKGRSSGKLSKLSILNPKYLWNQHVLAGNIKSVNDRLDLIVRNNSLSIPHSNASSNRGHPVAPTSFAKPKYVHGRERVCNNIMSWLTETGNTNTDLSIYPLVGTCGIGKTTLARLVFDDLRVQKHFDLCIWIHVSNEFNFPRLLNQIMECVTGDRSWAPDSLEVLQNNLREKIRGRRFFLVLDDMWNDRSEDWEHIQSALNVGARGSWILVTTRSCTVAKVGTVQQLSLERLSFEDCWHVFKDHAFDEDEDPAKFPQLQEIGRRIVADCRGLPYAAKIMGRKLRFKRDQKDWEDVLQNWQPNMDTEVERSLMASCLLLPAELQMCLRYFSIFPKDFLFDRQGLILLWMAQDLLHPRTGQRMEDAGREYFDTLLQESIIRRSPTDPSKFTVQDIFHDLSRRISQDDCCAIKNGNANSGEINHNNPNIRHLSLMLNHSWPRFFQQCIGVSYAYPNLRSLVLFCNSPTCMQGFPDTLAINLPQLRILDLSNAKIQNLNDTIGNLVFLRYLNLSNTDVQSIPNSLHKLPLLQSLLLVNCYGLTKLPQSVGTLSYLRHLDLHLDTNFSDFNEHNLVSMPKDIGKLSNLQTLSRFVISKDSRIGQLGNLNQLHGDLFIANLQNIQNQGEARAANLERKKYIDRLKLQWNGKNPFSYMHKGQEEGILDALKPNANIRDLCIDGYNGNTLPSWISGFHLTNLARLEISRCRNWTRLPLLGQLDLLVHLKIRGMDSIVELDCEFCGRSPGFRSLKTLEFDNMQNWIGWSGKFECRMPSLSSLIIKDCPKLAFLTHKLPSIEYLEIVGCPQITCMNDYTSLSSVRVEDSGEWILGYWPFLYHIESLTLQSLSTTYMVGLILTECDKISSLEITHCNQLTALSDDWFPFNLVQLSIRCCPNLQVIQLGELLQLVELQIEDCNALLTLPELQQLINLEFLKLSGCPQLHRLPILGFPDSLNVFSMSKCPLLKNCCTPDWGSYWPKLAKIPLVFFAFHLIIY